MDNAGLQYCFSMDDGVGYYKVCKAWPKKQLFKRLDLVSFENPKLAHACKVLKSKLSSHEAREKLGSGMSVGVLTLRKQDLNEDVKRIRQLAEASGVLAVEIRHKSSCFTTRHELRVYGIRDKIVF